MCVVFHCNLCNLRNTLCLLQFCREWEDWQDVASNTCLKAGIKVCLQELVVKAPANVPCPNDCSCLDGNTCCPAGKDAYGYNAALKDTSVM